jgi:hypothetical protein
VFYAFTGSVWLESSEAVETSISVNSVDVIGRLRTEKTALNGTTVTLCGHAIGTVSTSSALPQADRKAPSVPHILLDTTHLPGYAFNMVGMVIPLFGLLDGYDVLGMFHR